MRTSDASPGALELLPRLGYAARGIVYLIVGGLAVAAALGQGGTITDTHGALEKILRQPLGGVLLAILAAGLIGFALWRLAQSLLDADRHGTDAKALLVRAGLFVSAVLHGALALFAIRLILAAGAHSSGDAAARDWTASLMAQPYGRWLVGAVGAAVIGAGLAQIAKGWTADFARRFDMDARDLRWAVPVSRFGLTARGVVFAIIGGFLILAALQADSGQAVGLKGALDALRAQPYGTWLLGLVAAGLFAFGGYSLIESAYRRIACERAFPTGLPPSGLVRAAAPR